MYCIDTGAIAFMFNGGSSCCSTIHPKYAQNMAFWHPGSIYAVHP